MAEADASCRLFDPALGAALAAAKAQARGAALRSGVTPAALGDIEIRARAAVRNAGCASADVATAAGRVRSAFAGYAQLREMRYPGDAADWIAQRPPDDGVAHWRLSQRVRFGWDQMVFGIVGHGPGRGLLAVASFADGAQPYSARLVIRDQALTVGPYIAASQGDAHGWVPLSGRLPPRSATRVFSAEAMSPAGRDLRPADIKSGLAFRFPAEAMDALAALDPREAVAVEFLFPGAGADQVRAAYVEVGDFAAGRAFETLAAR
ncbi:MAG: hypothetical protein ACHP84_03250 [Caulobacterales bacterium]